MGLAAHVSAEDIFNAAADHGLNLAKRDYTAVPFGGKYRSFGLPHEQIPEEGVPPSDAYDVVSNELSRDGTPVLNLASFVSTEVDDYAKRLFSEHYNINLADGDEYPSTINLHGRCVSMISDLWHAPKTKTDDGQDVRALGTATTGSSEGIMLGALALKKRWALRRKAQGKPVDNPNMIVGANTQVCVEKAARYFDIELRLVPVSEESYFRLDTKKALEMCDENTIAVVVIAGSTYTGAIEPTKEMAERLDEFEAKTGLDIPIHVDAASGGFVLPFAWPNLEWDFRVKRVASINSSGHKFGIAPVGLGWVIWRTPDHLPKELLFQLSYLGSEQIDFNLNFSRPAAQMLVQYYNFIQLGREGYRNMVAADLRNARLFARAIECSGYFEVVSQNLTPAGTTGQIGQAVLDESEPTYYVPSLPVVAFRYTKNFREQYPHIQQKWVQTLLRAKGWIVPNYPLPAPLGDQEVLRIVCRNSLSEDLVATLVEDLFEITEDMIGNVEGPGALANAATKAVHPDAAQPPVRPKDRTRRINLYNPTRFFHASGSQQGHPGHNKPAGFNRTC